MHTIGANPHQKLFEPQALRIRGGLTGENLPSHSPAPARGAMHDFLVMNQRPDLAPEPFAPAPAGLRR